jgi:hypothetical protein
MILENSNDRKKWLAHNKNYMSITFGELCFAPLNSRWSFAVWLTPIFN